MHLEYDRSIHQASTGLPSLGELQITNRDDVNWRPRLNPLTGLDEH